MTYTIAVLRLIRINEGDVIASARIKIFLGNGSKITFRGVTLHCIRGLDRYFILPPASFSLTKSGYPNTVLYSRAHLLEWNLFEKEIEAAMMDCYFQGARPMTWREANEEMDGIRADIIAERYQGTKCGA